MGTPVNDSTLQRNLESLEQKYIHLVGSAQKHLSILEDQASELKLKSISREARINQLQDKYEGLATQHATLKEEVAGLMAQNATLKENSSKQDERIADLESSRQATTGQLHDAREENKLLLLQLHQVQEELRHYFFENQRILQDGQRKDDKLNWLRGQRELLLRMLHQQVRLQQRFIALDGRTALPSILRRLAPWWQRLQLS